MSYTVLTAAEEEAGEPAKIRFHYTTDSIFNSLDLRTHYRARMMKDGAGESLLDDVAISQDETDMVKELLEEAVYEVGAEMFKIAQGVANSIFFHSRVALVTEPVTYVFAEGSESSGFEIVDNAAYNTNVLPAIDKKILNCLRYYCLSSWWGVVGSAADVQSNETLYQINLRKMKNLTFQLRKPTMS